jgi:hypothetical protein
MTAQEKFEEWAVDYYGEPVENIRRRQFDHKSLNNVVNAFLAGWKAGMERAAEIATQQYAYNLAKAIREEADKV